MKDISHSKELPSKDGLDLHFYALIEYDSPIDVYSDDEDTAIAEAKSNLRSIRECRE